MSQLLPNLNQQSMTQSNRHVTLWRKIFGLQTSTRPFPSPLS